METSDWISLGALVAALAALFISVREALSNRPQLRIVSSENSYPNDFPGFSYFRIINFGRQPTTILAVTLSTSEGLSTVSFGGTADGKPLPQRLEVGDHLILKIQHPLCREHDDNQVNKKIVRVNGMMKVEHAWSDRPYISNCIVRAYA